MIKQGDTITNTRTGQTMIFLKTGKETNGELLEIECYSPPSNSKEPEHVHPKQTNNFKMISGSCVFSVDGKEEIVEAGQKISVPPNTKHRFWNPGNMVAHYIQEFRPALHIDEFFETFFALSRDGKLNDKGIPDLFHGSLIMLKHKDEIRIVSPPWPVQLLTYWILSPFGKLAGYQNSYNSKS
jgi:quercetin dioxygenase-like cupin family protein